MNVPRARQTSAGRVSRKRFIRVLAAAQDADRQAATERLAVGHHVAAHAEVLLRATGGEAEADEDLVEDEDDAALGAYIAQLLQPARVGLPVEGCASATVEQRRVTRGRPRSDASPG